MQLIGDEKVPKGGRIMFFANNDRENNGSSPKDPAAAKDVTVVFVN